MAEIEASQVERSVSPLQKGNCNHYADGAPLQ